MLQSGPTPSRPLVRLALSADVPAILGIQSRAYPETLRESGESFANKMTASPTTCFVAVVGAEIAGYLMTLPCTRDTLPLLDSRTFSVPSSADTLYIHDLAVSPDFRGCGIPDLLLNEAFARAATQHLRSACLLAVQGTASFWQKKHQFFAPEAVSESLMVKVRSYGTDAVFMERNL